jgi:hypothetical protein
MTHTIGNSHVEYPATLSIEVHYKLLRLRYYENQCIHSRTLDRISYETHHQQLMHVDSPTCTATQIDGNTSISNLYPTLKGLWRLYTMCTSLSSFFRSENNLSPIKSSKLALFISQIERLGQGVVDIVIMVE